MFVYKEGYIRTSSHEYKLDNCENQYVHLTNNAVQKHGNGYGKFEDGEPWFELRMTMFLDWYLLSRVGPEGMTPVERYLTHFGHALSKEEHEQMVHLTTTMRSVFSLVNGAHWSIKI